MNPETGVNTLWGYFNHEVLQCLYFNMKEYQTIEKR